MITLLTDFGLIDAYVGIMKGVILGIHPTAMLVDLSHHIPAQDIYTAGFQLANAYPYFPPNTIHMAVVDPGVGSSREAIAVDLGQAKLVGPNNGVFGPLLQKKQPLAAVKLDHPAYWTQQTPSLTFHGRDLFAPAAAYLSKGVAMSKLGSSFPIEQLVIPSLYEDGNHLETGKIQAIDHFGNLITTISADMIQGRASWAIRYQESLIMGSLTYSTVEPGEAIALIGSHGFIEIAINQGNAQAHFQTKVGALVHLTFPT